MRKLAAFVCYMAADTKLVFKYIEDYVWGVRTSSTFRFEADPIMGLMHWDVFMKAVKVLTYSPGEPRRSFDLDDLYFIMVNVDPNDFRAV